MAVVLSSQWAEGFGGFDHSGADLQKQTLVWTHNRLAGSIQAGTVHILFKYKVIFTRTETC